MLLFLAEVDCRQAAVPVHLCLLITVTESPGSQKGFTPEMGLADPGLCNDSRGEGAKGFFRFAKSGGLVA
jgi:hypothetical protein